MSEAPLTAPWPAGLPEDWLNRRDLPCPRCGYNLRMLSVPRCPECGSRFRWQQLLRVHCPRCNAALYEVDGGECPRCALALDWSALLDHASVQDPRLYEYSPHPVRAALRTWLAVLVPWRFWRQVRLEMPPVVRRLRALRRAAVAVCVLGVSLIAGLSLVNVGWGALLFVLREQAAAYALALLLPVATIFGLPRFTPTLARFRVRDDQLLRCLAYGASGMAWIGLVFAGALLGVVALHFVRTWGLLVSIPRRAPTVFMPGMFSYDLMYNAPWFPGVTGDLVVDLLHGVLFTALLFAFIWWWVFLYYGLRTYLRLDRFNAVALFLSTQTCGILLLMVVLLPLGVGIDAVGRLQIWVGEVISSLLGG